MARTTGNFNSFALEELRWHDVLDEINSVNKEFAEMLRTLQPSKQLTLFKVTYPYGADILKDGVFNLPLKNE